ncbi:MAG: hypothetical protein WC626_08875 [Methanoregula sp.]
MYRSIIKRHAMAGSRLDRYARAGQPPGFQTGGARHSGTGVAEPFPVPLTFSKTPVSARPEPFLRRLRSAGVLYACVGRAIQIRKKVNRG